MASVKKLSEYLLQKKKKRKKENVSLYQSVFKRNWKFTYLAALTTQGVLKEDSVLELAKEHLNFIFQRCLVRCLNWFWVVTYYLVAIT